MMAAVSWRQPHEPGVAFGRRYEHFPVRFFRAVHGPQDSRKPPPARALMLSACLPGAFGSIAAFSWPSGKQSIAIFVYPACFSFCANRLLFLAASAYTDNCGFAPMLVGKMEASWMFRLAMW